MADGVRLLGNKSLVLQPRLQDRLNIFGVVHADKMSLFTELVSSHLSPAYRV